MLTFISLLALLSPVFSQIITQNSTNDTPLPPSNPCRSDYFPGTDTVIFTTPYTYAQVMSIIGSFKNLTWSGSPDSTVTLNGTDNTIGTARTYDLAGAHVIETLDVYSKPPDGPYDEVHSLLPLSIAAANLSVYSDYDGTTVVPICAGKASTFNFTINFCASNVTVAAGLLHQLHMTDAMTVGIFLGGQNFTSCDALNPSTTSSMPSATSSMPATTGEATRRGVEALMIGFAILFSLALI